MEASSPTPLAGAALTDALRRNRRWLFVSGALAVLAGAVAIVVPAIASVGTAIFIGWVLVGSSGVLLVDAFAVRDLGRTAVRLLLALLTLAAGLYLVIAPLRGTFTLTVMLVIWFVAVGIARIVAGLADRGAAGAGPTVLSGVISLILGVLIGVELPSSADWAIGLLVGIDFFFYGISALFLAAQLGRSDTGAAAAAASG
jgi:uncharacterized membrane protein HdeD (DUF308 family)